MINRTIQSGLSLISVRGAERARPLIPPYNMGMRVLRCGMGGESRQGDLGEGVRGGEIFPMFESPLSEALLAALKPR
jgi:hypothetical protein